MCININYMCINNSSINYMCINIIDWFNNEFLYLFEEDNLKEDNLKEEDNLKNLEIYEEYNWDLI
jgi:hypothetical protein